MPDLEKLLQAKFAPRHVKATLKHFQAMNAEFRQGAWEETISKSGKFVEAALKALYVHAIPAKPLPVGRFFKVDNVINELAGLPSATADDTVRLTIPRACRFVYDIASNRGARHDPDEIDPNLMDARAAIATAAWILAEMLRHAQKGALDPAAVKELVDGLTQRQHPVIEDVDGHVYFHIQNASARKVAVLSLWRKYPERLTREELTAAVMRHRFSRTNAAMAVSRIARLVDEDEKGRLKLLGPGRTEAEGLISGARLKK
jgi:hypothetical protein